ncbi:hypothetical protein F8388_003435 [Cannabis sativa]|jgi:hypothetical protein|uniref:Protein SIEVE ELEMENT OCCLUSION B n=1 Tax=Cannabis sativa TaxID=3483 RepID=A0A7J6F572_CANSA|nr:hypothetical protein F8388_003435 [Cannabis sativa]
MASILLSGVSKVVSTVQKHTEPDLNLFSMTDQKILDLIYATHVHADESFDEDSLFLIVENVLKRATQIVDKVVQGSQVHVENLEDRFPSNANFTVPLCTLKSIGSELSCKAPGEKVAHEATLAILGKLSNYSWEAKAVLTLAAFALEFGDFWLLAQHQQTDQLAKSLAILRKVPVLIKPAELQKRRQAILELNNLIKTTMQVIGLFDEFEKLSNTYDPKDVTGLAVALDHLPVDVYWCIVTIVACSTKICTLISEEEKPQDLAPYSQKVHYILNKIKIQLIFCRKQIDEAESYRRLWKLFKTPTEIMEIFKALVFTKGTVHPLIDGSTNKTVQIEVLRRKNLLLYITGLDITEEDITVLKPIYEVTRKDDKFKIVWIPVVEQWTEELKKKFESIRVKMPWYVVQYFSPIAGLKFIKQEWNYKGKPTLVVLNPQGKIENYNALHLIRVWGVKAFPFNKTVEEEISKELTWIGPLVHDIHPSIPAWVKEEKYIFFYGGKDNDWIQQFTKRATQLVNDPFIKDTLKIKIELFCVGKTAKGGEDHGILGKFWTGIESLFFTKAHKQAVDPVTQEIQKLLSYKNENGWAVLTKGSTVVVTGHGFTILRVLEEFDRWKDFAKDRSFEVIFKEYHSKVIQSVRHCCRLELPTVAGKAPDVMQCPECPRTMETFVSYKCCHIDGPTAGH